MLRARGALRAGAIAGLAAFGAGAGGLGIEVVLLSGAGVALGFDRSAAWGLALWLAAWSFGAWCAGRRVGFPRATLAGAGVAALLGAPLSLAILGWAAHTSSEPLALALVVLALALTGIPQGALLPLFARGAGDRRWAIMLLFAANLAGSVAGAEILGAWLPARAGRWPAAWCAGATSAVAAALAALVWSARATPATTGESASGPRLSLARAGLVLACVTAWIAGLEWIGLRLAVLWMGGMQRALVAVLAASLAALAAGAAVLAPLLPARRGSLALVLLLCLASTLWPFVMHGVLGTLPPGSSDFVRAAWIVGPALVPFGAVLPLLHRSLAGESGRRLGDLLLFESIGALVGLPLLHEQCAARFGLGGSLAALALCGGVAGLVLCGRSKLGFLIAAASLGCAFVAARADPPALRAPALDDPALQRLYFAEDECFAVSVVDDAIRRERTLLTDDFRATATGPLYLYMHALGHLPLLLHPSPRRVGVLALGTGTTAGAVALHPEVERIHVLEISRRVCEAVELFPPSAQGGFAEGLARALDGEDARVVLHLGDGRRTLGELEGELDVLTMEPLLPDSPYAVHLYTSEFYARARRALAPGGLLCQWVPTHALPSTVFATVVDAFTRSFPWSGIFLYGSQAILIGSERRPELETERFPARDSELGVALAALGLEEPAGVLARFVLEGEHWPRAERELRDVDPWILYRPRVATRQSFLDRAANLGRLRQLEADPAGLWPQAVDDRARERVAGMRLVHRAQEAWSRRLAELEGLSPPAESELPSLEKLREEIGRRSGHDPEARALLDELRLEELRLEGLVALARSRPDDALRAFLDARDLAGDRADLHLFIAVALELSGEASAARVARDRALDLCPRIFETPQGRKALLLAQATDLFGGEGGR